MGDFLVGLEDHILLLCRYFHPTYSHLAVGPPSKNKGPDEGSTERREATESSPFNRSEGYEITRLKTIGCEGTRSFRYREGAKNLWS